MSAQRMDAVPADLPRQPLAPPHTGLRLWCVAVAVLLAELLLAWPGGWTNDGRQQYEGRHHERPGAFERPRSR